MPEPTPRPADDPGRESPGAVPTDAGDQILKSAGLPPGQEGWLTRASLSLEAQAVALLYGVIPALVITGLVILFGRISRPAALIILSVGVASVASSILASLLRSLAALVRAGGETVESLARLERSLTEGLQRIAAAIESSGPSRSTTTPDPAGSKSRHLAEIRHAIRGRLWDESSTLVAAFADTHPDDPEVPRLRAELAEAQTAARNELLARIEASREVSEPERVLELRDELKPLADPHALRVLDRDLAKWMMMLIHRRLRSGTVRADVAVLAGRVATSLDETPEGASIRASLPTLRRAAGLCPRCAQPYTGIADACPACLASAPVTAATTFLLEPAPDDSGDEADPLDLGEHREIE